MKTALTKSFHFSSSYTKAGRMIGKNYILEMTIEAVASDREELFEKKIREELIRSLESVDLGLHVNFLKNLEINDSNLLKAFWTEIERLCPDFKLHALTLVRDAVTRTTLSA